LAAPAGHLCPKEPLINSIAIIGGTGAFGIVPSEECTESPVTTPYGDPSGPVIAWRSGDTKFYFLARHGPDGSIPPHRVNYRANVWALHQIRPDHVVAINAVGGIAAAARPGRLVFPDQLVDYTWGREHTYADGIDRPLNHVDFTVPVSSQLRARLIDQARVLGLDFFEAATYGATQGPRLETAAEIDRLERDGCDVVGMTAMPEAALARELDLDYAICAVVVNRAAGRTRSSGSIHDEIRQYLDQGMNQVKRLLESL